MLFLKKGLLSQYIRTKTFFILLMCVIVGWIFSRALQRCVLCTYEYMGAVTSNLFNGVLDTKSITSDLLNAKKLVEEQSRQVILLNMKIDSLEDQIKKIDKLEGFLNLKRTINYETIGATVIGRSAENWHKQIILNKGRNDKIVVGDSVISNNGVIGQVVEANKKSSIVQLISDPGYKLGCKVAKKNVIGILSGYTSSIGHIEFIPVGSDINVGDLVVTSGITSSDLLPIYPAGHPIGRICKVSKNKSKASDLYIEVKLFENLALISEVLVFSPG